MLRSSPLFQLYLVRLRDFYRQPARVFWVYGFPTIMAIVARVRVSESAAGADLSRPDARSGRGRGQGRSRRPTISSLESDKSAGKPRLNVPSIELHEASEDEASKRLKTGQDAAGHRAARLRIDASITTTRLGRKPARPARSSTTCCSRPPGARTRDQPSDVYVTEPGSRYIDFLIPGLIGLNAMGGGLWGIGFLVVNFRIAKLLKRFVATPMPRRDFLLALLGARLTFVIPDLTVLLLLGTLMFQMPIRGNLALVIAIDMLGALAFAGIGLLVGMPCHHHRDRQRPDEPGHAADVAVLRRLLLFRPVSRLASSPSSRPCRSLSS